MKGRVEGEKIELMREKWRESREIRGTQERRIVEKYKNRRDT